MTNLGCLLNGHKKNNGYKDTYLWPKGWFSTCINCQAKLEATKESNYEWVESNGK